MDSLDIASAKQRIAVFMGHVIPRAVLSDPPTLEFHQAMCSSLKRSAL